MAYPVFLLVNVLIDAGSYNFPDFPISYLGINPSNLIKFFLGRIFFALCYTINYLACSSLIGDYWPVSHFCMDLAANLANIPQYSPCAWLVRVKSHFIHA